MAIAKGNEDYPSHSVLAAAFQLSPACLMSPALMWSSTLVQWCTALLPCNLSGTQQAARLTVAFSS